MPRFLLLGVSAAALLPTAAAARLTPVPLGNGSVQLLPDPTPTPAPVPIPALPATRAPTLPPVVLPTPTATPGARPSPVVAAAPRTAAPRTRADTSPSERARPRLRPTPASPPSASPTPSAAPTPSAPPTSARAPIETVVLHRAPAAMPPLWPWLAGGALALLALALLLLRRRGDPEDEFEPVDEDIVDEQAAAPLPAQAAAPARLALDLLPTRAGLNLLTATVDAVVIVTNPGGAPADDMRAAVTLVGARGDVDADLRLLAEQPIGRPAVPPFALAPGEERRFRAVAALPIAAIVPMTAGDRPMFVPLVVVSIAWSDAAGEHRLTRGFAIGIERVDSAKLAPLWLDVPPRSYDTVAARAHHPAIER